MALLIALGAGATLAAIPAWVLTRPEEVILARLGTWAGRITEAHELRAAEDARVQDVLRDGQAALARQTATAGYLARRAGRPSTVAARIRSQRRPVSPSTTPSAEVRRNRMINAVVPR